MSICDHRIRRVCWGRGSRGVEVRFHFSTYILNAIAAVHHFASRHGIRKGMNVDADRLREVCAKIQLRLLFESLSIFCLLANILHPLYGAVEQQGGR